MADLGLIETEIKSLPAALQPTVLRIFRAFLKDVRFGHPSGAVPDPTLNMAGGFFHATTPAVAGTTFSIAHGFGRVPYLALPVLRLDAVGSSIVPVTVAQAADGRRVYLTSTVAAAPITLVLEG